MKRILIVGATSGIGEGLARLYAERGEVKIGVMGRRSGRLKDLCASRPDVFEAEVCDVTDTEALPVALERLASRLGGVDILVLSSGTGDLNPELDYAVERCTLDTNVTGWTCVADWAIRYFENRGQGHLATVTSVGGLRGSGAAPAYNATKSFQMNYLEGLRQRVAVRPADRGDRHPSRFCRYGHGQGGGAVLGRSGGQGLSANRTRYRPAA